MFTKTSIMFLAILVSCTSAQKSNSSAFQEKQDLSPAVEKYKALAIEKYKDHIDYELNESQTYVVCSRNSKSTPKMPQNSIYFFVYDLKNDRIVFEESVVDGSVTWINDNQIEIIQKTGTVSKENSGRRQGYIFDLTTKEKSDFSKKVLNLEK